MEAGRRNQSGNRDSQRDARKDPNRRVTVMKATEYDASAVDIRNKAKKDAAVSGGHRCVTLINVCSLAIRVRSESHLQARAKRRERCTVKTNQTK